MLGKYLQFFLEHKPVAYFLLLLCMGLGMMTIPFEWGRNLLPQIPVSVDAIPDIGENQQIIFTEWRGRSPQDVEDQITYPLSTALLGIPGVKSIRSHSVFGFSSIYLVFEEEIDFYWSRSRILEKLNALPSNTLPADAQPILGPNATPLGQIFWYTLEGQDESGQATGGWDLHELRSVQDYYVRYGLSGAGGVAEVASIGGFVKTYQVEADPDAMRIYGVSMTELGQAVRATNLDIGAQTLEINLAEYYVRGLGYVKSINDIEQGVIKAKDNIPIRIADVARVSIGPANRRGILDKSGAEAVGGVVVAAYGENPLQVIENIKEKIEELELGLPQKVLADGRMSKLTIVPFYDRSQLIKETLGTLENTLTLEILITIVVIILLLSNLKASLLVAGSLPLAVLLSFAGMRFFGVEANIVALSGIAIAIGTMVDMGIVLLESVVRRMRSAPQEETVRSSVYEGTLEVAPAIITAVATTVVSFLPVFTLEGAEGKLFTPLAYTKTFALVAAVFITLTLIPPLAELVLKKRISTLFSRVLINTAAILLGLVVAWQFNLLLGTVLLTIGLAGLTKTGLASYYPDAPQWQQWAVNGLYALFIFILLHRIWMPLGPNSSFFPGLLFIAGLVLITLAFFRTVIYYYESLLRFLLRFKWLYLTSILLLLATGFSIFRHSGQEFMPALDEGSFLLMPTAMPHAGMQANRKNLKLLDMAVTSIPEVELVVGKAGRVDSPLDPAPMSMYENVIQYKSEYKKDEQGRRVRFKYDEGRYLRDDNGQLIPDPKGRFFRQWRDEIRSPDDIWEEVVKVTQLPGLTTSPKLQPIQTRLVMLQSGMRSPMGIKIQGSDLSEIEAFGRVLEEHLKDVEGIKRSTVFAERIVGKPYLLIDIKRRAISRYNLSIEQVQQHIQAAIGGLTTTTTVEGRERYAIQVRYPRELREDPTAIANILVTSPNGQQIPLGLLVDIRYEAGPQVIKSEDGFLVGHVLFDKQEGYAELTVVDNAKSKLGQLINTGAFVVPQGISYRFAGSYEQQVRANQKLTVLIPLVFLIIFVILYLQFKSVTISLMVFSGVLTAFAGGFLMIGLYNTDWFLNFNLGETNLHELFQVGSVNLSVAVWVGFLALFGIAADDGILMATFLQKSFQDQRPTTPKEIEEAMISGGKRRVQPAMMTTATTLLALLPILTASGRGAEIMLPMAIPCFGGMALQVITIFTVPILFFIWKEWQFNAQNKVS